MGSTTVHTSTNRLKCNHMMHRKYLLGRSVIPVAIIALLLLMLQKYQLLSYLGSAATKATQAITGSSPHISSRGAVSELGQSPVFSGLIGSPGERFELDDIKFHAIALALICVLFAALLS